MFWEALGSTIVGLALAWAAAHRLPGRLPRLGLVLPTGAAGGLVGGLVASAVMGPGATGYVLLIAAGVSVAMLSLLHDRSGRAAVPPATVAHRAH